MTAIFICGETTGKFNRRRETWLWNEKVQQVIKEKKEAYKMIQDKLGQFAMV